MNVEIRRFRPGEEETLRLLYISTTREVLSHDYTAEQIARWVGFHQNPEEWRLRLEQRNPFVADRGGKLLGFAELEADGHIDYFYCHHEAVGKGIGSLLLGALETEAGRLGISELYAEVSVSAQPFFIRRGFRTTAIQDNLVCGTPARRFLMRKAL